MTQDDKNWGQSTSESTGIFSPDSQNKPIVQVNLKDLIAILLHPNVKRRARGEENVAADKEEGEEGNEEEEV